jgi:hypothetical protein
LAINRELTESLGINVIYVKERQKVGGPEPIEWLLITNKPIDSVAQAYEKVEYYVQRWKIERFHYVLKSGCDVEKIQERNLEKTNALLLLYSIISVFYNEFDIYCTSESGSAVRSVV